MNTEVSSLEFSPLGWKGAAFAALGDKPVILGVEPLMERDVGLREAGVKLGESTFNLFLVLETPQDRKLRSTS